MKTIELDPDQIITLNDYPLYSDDVLRDYFRKCKKGEDVELVPVIRKEVVRQYLDDDLTEEFKKFEEKNPEAEYFMLDGSHRTTALTLTGRKIKAVIYEKDEDIIEAKKSVESGKIRENKTLDHTLEENCDILNKHFNKKPYFMTVQEKTEKLLKDKKIMDYQNSILN